MANPEKAKQYCFNIWGEESTDEKDAEWLQKLREKVVTLQKENTSITAEAVTQFLKKVPN